jgi:hypothetical protein
MHDTLEYVKRLEAVGIPREQAEAQVRMMSEVIYTNLATRQDLKDATLATAADFVALRSEVAAEFVALRSEVAAEFAAVRSEMAAEFTSVRAEFKAVHSEIANLENRMTIKFGATMTVAMTILFAALKLT